LFFIAFKHGFGFSFALITQTKEVVATELVRYESDILLDDRAE